MNEQFKNWQDLMAIFICLLQKSSSYTSLPFGLKGE
jgi:hypothetical protein